MTKGYDLLKKKDYRYFQMAKEQAEKSDYNNIHVGCVIVYKNHIIGAGHNSSKSHTRQKRANRYRDFDFGGAKPIVHSVHAEIAALNSIPYPVSQNICWRDVKIYVYRICPGKPLKQGMARPCTGCMSELKKLGIKNYFYSTESGYCYEEIL